MPRTLIVTNDFPPRRGGIESFVHALAVRFPPEDVVVYTSRMPDSRPVDAALPFRVVRDSSGMLLPTKRVAAAVTELFRRENCSSVLYGASAPLGLLAPALRDAGARRQVAVTHGHEVWWARVPVTRGLLRKIGDHTDVMTYLGEYTRSRISAALTPAARGRMVRLAPGVDPDTFHPGCGGAQLREWLAIPPHRPVVLTVGRLTKRKGHDSLIEAWADVVHRVPDALLLIVGEGPDRKRLEGLIAASPVRTCIRLAGAVAQEKLASYFDAADVFAMPCRDRRGGLEHEGLGIVFLEAAATGLPVVAGRSGGSPDAVREGETGFVVDGTNREQLVDRVCTLLIDRELAAEMGARGREWMRDEWNWDDHAARVRRLLELP